MRVKGLWGPGFLFLKDVLKDSRNGTHEARHQPLGAMLGCGPSHIQLHYQALRWGSGARARARIRAKAKARARARATGAALMWPLPLTLSCITKSAKGHEDTAPTSPDVGDPDSVLIQESLCPFVR